MVYLAYALIRQACHGYGYPWMDISMDISMCGYET